MGMFTTIRNPRTGVEVQIKCGWDECGEFNLGDTVPWRPIKGCAGQGYLFDDVYSGVQSGDVWNDENPNAELVWWWVVIKDHVVQEMFLQGLEEDSETHSDLMEKYAIQGPPDDLWPEKDWADHHAMVARIEKETEEFKASIAHLPYAERSGRLLHRLFGRRINYGEVMRNLIQVEPLPLPQGIHTWNPDEDQDGKE